MVLQIRSVFFFQTFKDGIRQFLRGDFCPDVFRVLLRIVVTPVVIFVLRDLTTPETDGLFFPCCEVFADPEELFCLILAEKQSIQEQLARYQEEAKRQSQRRRSPLSASKDIEL